MTIKNKNIKPELPHLVLMKKKIVNISTTIFSIKSCKNITKKNLHMDLNQKKRLKDFANTALGEPYEPY